MICKYSFDIFPVIPKPHFLITLYIGKFIRQFNFDLIILCLF